MTLLPRTLFGRNVLLLLALIVFGQLTGALLFMRFVQKPRVEQLAGIAVRQIESSQAMLDAVTAEQRTVLIERINEIKTPGAPQVLITLQSPINSEQQVVARFSLRDQMMEKFVQLLAQRLQFPVEAIRWSTNGNGELWVPVQLGNVSYWMNLRNIWPDGDLFTVWLSLSLLTGVLAVCGAYLIQGRINRPLQRLVIAAQQLAKGETPAQLDENVPTEIATVSRSFNQMTTSLEAIDRERAIMLAGVSHDLRTPLAKVRLGIAILQSKAEIEIIDSMTRSCEEMDSIIDQFLDYARVGSNELPQLMDLNQLVRDCVQAYAVNGQALSAELVEVPPVLLRRQAMERLLTNLVENALRYGAPPFHLTTQLHDQYLQLCVMDHGPGIPDVELESIKRPFVRGNAARAGKAGAGLGLSIVERIAQLHGGKLTLQRGDSAGLLAVVEIPLPSK